LRLWISVIPPTGLSRRYSSARKADIEGYGPLLAIALEIHENVDTKVRGPGIFFILQRPLNLLSATYAHLAQFIANRVPLEECSGCGRMFVRRSRKQKYCTKSRASTSRWRRWKASQNVD
jgi:hypothetical protein